MRDDATLEMAKDIVYTHHERWDGTGYPQGLRGTAIPVVGRVMAIVDVYDAVVARNAVSKVAVARRQPSSSSSPARAPTSIPAVVDAFLIVAPVFERVSREAGS